MADRKAATITIDFRHLEVWTQMLDALVAFMERATPGARSLLHECLREHLNGLDVPLIDEDGTLDVDSFLAAMRGGASEMPR